MKSIFRATAEPHVRYSQKLRKVRLALCRWLVNLMKTMNSFCLDRVIYIFIKDVGMDITTNKLNWRHRFTTPWRIDHTILLLSWQTTKPYGYFCTFKTDIAIPLPRLLITACNAKPIIFIPVTDVTIRLPVLSMTSYHNCTQFALIGDNLTDISSLIHVWPSW